MIVVFPSWDTFGLKSAMFSSELHEKNKGMRARIVQCISVSDAMPIYTKFIPMMEKQNGGCYIIIPSKIYECDISHQCIFPGRTLYTPHD